MKIEMVGYIENVGMKIDASSDLIKQVRLAVHGDISALEELMKQPLTITFEAKQLGLGDKVPER